MTNRKEFEAMLEALINEDQEAARDIFHNIVVAKSRQIYETLLAEDFNLYEKDDESEEPEMGDTGIDDEDEFEEPDMGDMDLGDEDEDEVPNMGDMDLGDEDEGDLEDRVVDLEDALEELKAEFEELMADKEGDEFGGEEDEFGNESDLDSEEDEFGEPGLGDMDLGDEDEDEFGGPSAGGMGRSKPMYEYKDRVTAKMGDNGVNTTSVTKPFKGMGGTAANIVSGDVAEGNGGTKGGLLNPTPKDIGIKNRNSKNPTGNKAFTDRVKEPKSSDTSDRRAQSPINGVKSRAK